MLLVQVIVLVTFPDTLASVGILSRLWILKCLILIWWNYAFMYGDIVRWW